MQASSNPENEKLGGSLKALEKISLKKTKGVLITITLFENAQCKVLVEHGLATSVSALAKKALLKYIWQNEDKIPEKLIPPKRKKGWKDKHQKKKRRTKGS